MRPAIRILAIAALVFLPAYAFAGDAPPAVTWDGARAMKDIETQVSFGPRSLAGPGHQKEIDFIKQQLAKTTTDIVEQKWPYALPYGKPRMLTNIIAHFGPPNTRILLGTHYDSLVRAYRDTNDPHGYMPGANNSASGVALLLETARALKADTNLRVGVDMVFFDGEEGPFSLGGGDKTWRPLGSPYFASQLSKIYTHDKPEVGIVFDMVCYKDIKLKAEPFSIRYAEKPMQKFWTLGGSIAPAIFSREVTRYGIEDDQIALSRAGIPSFLVIGFEYEPWFDTTMDTPDKCSPDVMEGLGKTVLSYISSLWQPAP